MQRRHFLPALVLPGLAGTVWSQEPAPPVVRSSRIIEALSQPRDIALDRPQAPGMSAPPSPSIALQVQFTFGSAQLLPQGKQQLDELAMALSHTELNQASFELGGHTDRVGSHSYNMRLSLDRAEAVKAYLVSSHRLNAARLYPIGFGFTRLVDPVNPEAAVNRRVEVRRLPRAPQAEQIGGALVPTPRR
jgi:outer membrane protein OmpA-like peptidoglycan-associated protein